MFKGKTNIIEKWHLLSGTGNDNNEKTHTCYLTEVGETHDLNGLRLRLLFIMSGISSLAAPFITLSGLTNRELPVDTCPSGVIYIEIEGLCTGASTYLIQGAVDYVAFVRKNSASDDRKSAEVRNFEY